MDKPRNITIGIGLLTAGVVLFAAWGLARAGLGLYIDALWFAAAGYERVFWTLFRTRLLLGGVTFAVAAPLFMYNVLAAYRRAPMRDDSVLSRLCEGDVDPARADMLVRRLALAGCLGLALVLALSAARHWAVFLSWRHAEPFGLTDPVFGHDIGFYVFVLPGVAYAGKLAVTALIIAAGLALGVYYVRGAVDFERQGPLFPAPVFRHFSFLGAPAVAVLAMRFWLEQFRLLVSKRGAVFGAGYTDIHAQIGANHILALAGLALAAWLLINAVVQRRPANLYAVTGFAVLWLGIGVAYPWAVQAFVVRPNEWERENAYLARSIEYTRMAYGLDSVVVSAWPGDAALSPDALRGEPGTVDNLPLWEAGPLRDVYNQKQRIRTYYTFADVDTDRYTVGGRMRPLNIAPRELDLAQLPAKSRVWTNLHLYYTHGYGLCMSFLNRTTEGGLPEFAVSNIPPETGYGLGADQPRVYYGELTRSYALVNTRLDEFDYPGDPENHFNRYDGAGGIPAGGPVRRALLAWHTGHKDLLFTGQCTPESKVLLYRRVRERAARLAPFLYFDEDPYPVLHEGRIVWVLDAYTITRRFPYSEAIGIANYWRNSVKATVDAYDGTVTFYRTDQAGPIFRVFEKAFPELFKPLSTMPASLRAHLRYPFDLFRVQSTIYHKYHVDDPQVFFNGEDVWTFPKLTEAGAVRYQRPRYTVMHLPGAREREEFLLVQSFTVEGRDNMVAWLAARCDPAHYGELHLLRFPKRRNIYGPSQAKGRFNQDPRVSEFTTLMGQLGSAVIQTSVFPVPISDGLLYIQSLFIEDPEVKIPELKQIVVGTGDRVAMAPDIGQALTALFSEPQAATGVEEARPAQPTDEPAAALYEKARGRLKAGDWAGFGEAFDALGDALQHNE